jgi:hypothetical protein
VEPHRFDAFTRALAGNSSRRSVLKGLLGGAAAGVAGLAGVAGASAAPGGNGNAGGGSKKPDCCPTTLPRLCGNTCTDPQSDPNNCGACGTVCASGVCTNGACTPVTGCIPGQQQSCDTGVPGICAAGMQTCQPDGTWGTCVQNQQPQPETCNGLDDDCDGVVDNGSNLCPTGFICQSGACVAVNGCTPGATQSCYSGPPGTAGVGACQYGMQTCQQDGTWGACQGEVTPQPETCNNIDDDCNGIVDDGFDLLHDVNNCGSCGHVCYAVNGTPACANGSCTIAVCDSGFADCNGDPADGCETNVANDPNNCGACGNVCGTGQTCQSGSCV